MNVNKNIVATLCAQNELKLCPSISKVTITSKQILIRFDHLFIATPLSFASSSIKVTTIANTSTFKIVKLSKIMMLAVCLEMFFGKSKDGINKAIWLPNG